MKTLLFSLLLFSSMPLHASTAAMDGNELLVKCKAMSSEELPATMTNKETLDWGFCAGYVTGVIDVERIGRVWRAKPRGPRIYCLPEEVTNGQILKIVKKWLDNNPEKLHWRADLIIHRALLEAFPCKQNRN